MKEIEVVVDIRQSPDTSELIVTKQKLAADALHFVGEPTERRVGMAADRARVTLDVEENDESLYGMVAHVQNIDQTPLEVTRVEFEHQYNAEFPARGLHPVHVSSRFGPRDPRQTGPLQPGETRDWYLQPIHYDNAARVASALSPDQFCVVAYSGNEEVGRITGRAVHPFLNMWRVMVGRRANIALATLPEHQRLRVLEAAWSLPGADPSRWSASEVKQLSAAPPTYLLDVAPDLRLFLTPAEDGRIEIVDIVRKGALEQFRDNQHEARVQG